jgi:hypothetical protein
MTAQGPHWLLYLVIIGALTVFSVWRFWKLGISKSVRPTQMTEEDVIAIVRAAILFKWPDSPEVHLTVIEQPRPANDMVWVIREVNKGSWWEAKVDDATGEINWLERQGLR